eukprot:TRINITY_DN215_c0_g1_i6.p2 TRINITY_DN215_c0_g1~~TRINITY_DN215_c0_g1_i6.p2  ORF type:complete len:417 (-),score=47.18 TRINITY_DN215_c0_g1_i6:649-1899(-)
MSTPKEQLKKQYGGKDLVDCLLRFLESSCEYFAAGSLPAELEDVLDFYIESLTPNSNTETNTNLQPEEFKGDGKEYRKRLCRAVAIDIKVQKEKEEKKAQEEREAKEKERKVEGENMLKLLVKQKLKDFKGGVATRIEELKESVKEVANDYQIDQKYAWAIANEYAEYLDENELVYDHDVAIDPMEKTNAELRSCIKVIFNFILVNYLTEQSAETFGRYLFYAKVYATILLIQRAIAVDIYYTASIPITFVFARPAYYGAISKKRFRRILCIFGLIPFGIYKILFWIAYGIYLFFTEIWEAFSRCEERCMDSDFCCSIPKLLCKFLCCIRDTIAWPIAKFAQFCRWLYNFLQTCLSQCVNSTCTRRFTFCLTFFVLFGCRGYLKTTVAPEDRQKDESGENLQPSIEMMERMQQPNQ